MDGYVPPRLQPDAPPVPNAIGYWLPTRHRPIAQAVSSALLRQICPIHFLLGLDIASRGAANSIGQLIRAYTGSRPFEIDIGRCQRLALFEIPPHHQPTAE